jgi:hypothetical protein
MICVAIGNRFIAVIGGGANIRGSPFIELIDTMTGESSMLLYDIYRCCFVFFVNVVCNSFF